jgi:hypothetical protein
MIDTIDATEGQTMTLDPVEGGKARWKGTTAEERSEAARRAAESRWNAKLPQATHEGVLPIGNRDIQCYVLQGGERVISTRGVMKALGRRWRGRKHTGTELPVFLEAKNLKPFISEDLAAVLSVVEFATPRGARAEGFKAKLLPLLCETYLSARDANALTATQLGVAAKADILMRALAHVGIIALVDEATGYQYDRPRRDLEKHLKEFLAESLVRWVRTFPNDYFKHLCRLKGVEVRPDMRLPQYFGHLTNKLVYRRIAPGLLTALKERRAERGTPSNKLHWWTSEDLGHPSLLLHLGTVVGLMKINTDYETFVKQLDQIAPIYPETPGLYDDPADWERPAIGG